MFGSGFFPSSHNVQNLITFDDAVFVKKIQNIFNLADLVALPTMQREHRKMLIERLNIAFVFKSLVKSPHGIQYLFSKLDEAKYSEYKINIAIMLLQTENFTSVVSNPSNFIEIITLFNVNDLNYEEGLFSQFLSSEVLLSTTLAYPENTDKIGKLLNKNSELNTLVKLRTHIHDITVSHDFEALTKLHDTFQNIIIVNKLDNVLLKLTIRAISSYINSNHVAGHPDFKVCLQSMLETLKEHLIHVPMLKKLCMVFVEQNSGGLTLQEITDGLEVEHKHVIPLSRAFNTPR